MSGILTLANDIWSILKQQKIEAKKIWMYL